MTERRMNYLRTLAISLQQIGSDLGVATFGIVVGRLPDIVQQPTTTRQSRIHPQLRGDLP